MVPYAELDAFFTGLVATAQSRGITCAITSGMACVHFGVAAATIHEDVVEWLPVAEHHFSGL
jgi:hypothetical protein